VQHQAGCADHYVCGGRYLSKRLWHGGHQLHRAAERSVRLSPAADYVVTIYARISLTTAVPVFEILVVGLYREASLSISRTEKTTLVGKPRSMEPAPKTDLITGIISLRLGHQKLSLPLLCSQPSPKRDHVIRASSRRPAVAMTISSCRVWSLENGICVLFVLRIR